jgi:hypothetical protein
LIAKTTLKSVSRERLGSASHSNPAYSTLRFYSLFNYCKSTGITLTIPVLSLITNRYRRIIIPHVTIVECIRCSEKGNHERLTANALKPLSTRPSPNRNIIQFPTKNTKRHICDPNVTCPSNPGMVRGRAGWCMGGCASAVPTSVPLRTSANLRLLPQRSNKFRQLPPTCAKAS